jgi:opacity protein-like surface antigen
LILLFGTAALGQSYDETSFRIKAGVMKMLMSDFNNFVRDRAISLGAAYGIEKYRAEMISSNWKWSFDILHRLSEHARVGITFSGTGDQGSFSDVGPENSVKYNADVSTFDVTFDGQFLYPFWHQFTAYVGAGVGIGSGSMSAEEQYSDKVAFTINASEYSTLFTVGEFMAGVDFGVNEWFFVSTEIDYKAGNAGEMGGNGSIVGPLFNSKGEKVSFDYSGFSVMLGIGARFSL